jgi:hypothetical protein
MPRPILEEARIHPAIRDKVATNRTDIVREVEAAAAALARGLTGVGLKDDSNSPVVPAQAGTQVLHENKP